MKFHAFFYLMYHNHMKVTIDIRLLANNRFSGVEEYARNLTQSLIEESSIEWNLFYNTHKTPPKLPDSWYKENVTVTNLKLPNKLLDLSGKITGFPKIDTITKADLIISPHLNFISHQNKRILVIHDLSFLHYPNFFSWQDKVWHAFQDVWTQIIKADHIVTDSNFTKADIINFFKVKEDKISVIYPGISHEFEDAKEDQNFLKKYNLNKPYILYLGSFEPRKNVPALIKAFNLLNNKNIDLVLCGGKKWLDHDIKEAINTSPNKNNIKIINNIVPEERKLLYNKAMVFVYPSFFEGFGFPPLEAQISGTPVISCWELIPDMPKRSNFRSNRTFQQAKDEYRARIAALGRDEWLWDVELLDNTTVYEDPTSHRDPAYVFLRYKVLAEEAKRRWPEKKELWKEYADFDEVDYTEYWSKPVTERDGTTTPGEFIQWVERDVVHDDENPYPYIPVIIEDAGFGVNHRFAKPADKFVGMTQHAFPIFEAEAIQMTSLQEVTKISAFPMIKSRNMADDKQINVGPGTVIPLEGGKNDPDAEDVEIEQWPNVPDSVLGMLEKTDRLANSTFKMNVLGGVPQKGVETASEADQNVRNATAKLTSPVAALERLVMRITTQVFIDIEQVLHAPVTVFGTNAKDEGESTLRPTDINRYYQVSAELGTSDEEALSENKARFWMEAALRAPFLSYRTAMERGGITEEPMQELITRSAEEVYLSDAFKQIRIVTGAQSFGELQAYIEQLQNGGGAPAPGGGNATGGGVNDRTGLQGDDPATTLLNSALRDRDTNLGASQLEA